MQFSFWPAVASSSRKLLRHNNCICCVVKLAMFMSPIIGDAEAQYQPPMTLTKRDPVTGADQGVRRGCIAELAARDCGSALDRKASKLKPAKTIMVLVIGLALMSSGCASMRPPATPPAANREAGEAQQKQEETKKEFALEHDPVGESFYIANGLAELGNYLSGGK